MKIPTVRFDILFYYCIIIFLLTITYTQKEQIKVIQDELTFIKNSLQDSIVLNMEDTEKWEKEWDEKNGVAKK